jgi:hypothetical protein
VDCDIVLCMLQLNLLVRAYHRILKLSKPIADLAGNEKNCALSGGAAIPSEVDDRITESSSRFSMRLRG